MTLYVQVVTPIVAMKAGEDYQQYVDLLVPHKAKFKLVHGEGPISLSGSHCVDFYGYKDLGPGDDDDTAEEDGDSEVEMEDAKK